jgi:hypothetical protein
MRASLCPRVVVLDWKSRTLLPRSHSLTRPSPSRSLSFAPHGRAAEPTPSLLLSHHRSFLLPPVEFAVALSLPKKPRGPLLVSRRSLVPSSYRAAVPLRPRLGRYDRPSPGLWLGAATVRAKPPRPHCRRPFPGQEPAPPRRFPACCVERLKKKDPLVNRNSFVCSLCKSARHIDFTLHNVFPFLFFLEFVLQLNGWTSKIHSKWYKNCKIANEEFLESLWNCLCSRSII